MPIAWSYFYDVVTDEKSAPKLFNEVDNNIFMNSNIYKYKV